MSDVELWVGRAGTGKSTAILNEIVRLAAEEPFGSPIWWVVPSGASYATERMLLEQLPATVRVEVITLRRLAERAMENLGNCVLDGDESMRRLNQTGKRMIMAQAYSQCRPNLSVFYRDDASIPFLDGLLQAISELEQYHIGQAELEQVRRDGRFSVDVTLSQRIQTAVEQKLSELVLLQRAVGHILRRQSLWDSEQLLSLVSPYLADWITLHAATVYVDGFSSWTPAEARFAANLAQSSQRFVLALPMDPSWVEESGVPWDEEPYAPQAIRLWTEFLHECRKIGVDVSSTRAFTEALRFHHAEALGHLERHLFGFRRSAYGSPDAVSQIRITAAQNPRVEVSGTIHQLQQLVQQSGRAFRDMAIVVPSLTEYLEHIRDGFEQAGIPYTTDDFPGFSTHPLARLLTAVLDAAEDGLTRTTAFRILKTEFPGLSRDHADWLEDYVRRYDVPEDVLWNDVSDWTFAAESGGKEATRANLLQSEDAKANDLRRQWCTIFHPIVVTLSRSEIVPAELGMTLWNLLEVVGARRQVAKWMVNEDATLSPLEASLHEQAWDFVVDLLEDFDSAPDGTVLPLEFASRLLRIAISECVLSTIPGNVDSVLVTEAGRAEGWDCAIVFVLGVFDGAFPSRIQPSGVWLDEERSAFAEVIRKPLGITTEERQWDERYSVYRAMTRAREQLWLSYPLANGEGKSRQPAGIMGRVKRLFSEAGVQEVIWTLGFDPNQLADDITSWNKEAALAWLSGALRQRSATRLEHPVSPTGAKATLRWLRQDPLYREKVARMNRGTQHRVIARPLEGLVSRKLFKGPATVNVSQLETFAACPFQHYAKYGLRISEPASGAGRLPAARGTLVHDVLHAYVLRLMNDYAAWKALSDEESVAVMRDVFAEALAAPEFSAWGRSALRARVAGGALRVLEHAAIVLTEHARHSAFEPRLLEFTFDDGFAGDAGFQLGLQDGGTLRLRGRIDRVDVVAESERHVFRIIDYKSSQLSLDLTRVWHGLQLQLPVYAAMIERMSTDLFGRKSEPAGVLYFPVLRKVSSVLAPDSAHKAMRTALGHMKTKGLLVEDVQIVDWMDNRLTGTGDSNLFSKVYNKDGSVGKRAPVLGQAVWRGLLDHALDKTAEMAQEIAEGRIAISPYRMGGVETACQTCGYRLLCHIDPRYDATPFRRLSPPENLVGRLTPVNGRMPDALADGGNAHE